MINLMKTHLTQNSQIAIKSVPIDWEDNGLSDVQETQRIDQYQKHLLAISISLGRVKDTAVTNHKCWRKEYNFWKIIVKSNWLTIRWGMGKRTKYDLALLWYIGKENNSVVNDIFITNLLQPNEEFEIFLSWFKYGRQVG